MAEIRAYYTKETHNTRDDEAEPKLPIVRCNCSGCRKARGGYDLNPLEKVLITMFVVMFITVLSILSHVVK
jgi:hypothetical protein